MTAGSDPVGASSDLVHEAHPLTDAEVSDRVRSGRVNAKVANDSRSVVSILRANILTRFNAIITAMLVVVLIAGDPADAMFGIVMVVNAMIGIVQELRAKRTLDRLTLLVEPKAVAIREEGVIEIAATDIVLDDLLRFTRGHQIPVDAVVVTSDGLEVSEALLTGEVNPIRKDQGDTLLSGSFVVAGAGECVATAVGDDAYANQLAHEARQFTLARSELTEAINKILRLVTWLLIPTSALLLWSQMQSGQDIKDAAVATVAGVVAMVPQGLVLLVSMALAVAVVKLGKKNVLVQELPAVETLARVNLLCIDKTGTLTDGGIKLDSVEVLGSVDLSASALLSKIVAADPDPNPTMAAIAERYPADPSVLVDHRIAFSSERKTSAVSFSDGTAWVMGAPEFVLGPDLDGGLAERVRTEAAAGHRTILVAGADYDALSHGDVVAGAPEILLTFNERIRPDADATVQYFHEQDVTLKVISGDAPLTVAAVARATNVPGDIAVDARTLPAAGTEELLETANAATVFGRVAPEQKRELVQAFQSQGHVVAMTGDGVNDVLALKTSDLGIAMGSGSGAARAVSQLVLLDDAFSSLPDVVAEGRRVVANMERVASLFLTKTVYATVLAVLIGFVGLAFPFLPRHLTLIGSLTIGIPAFLLSFEPRELPIRPGFLPRVLAFAVPAGLVSGVATFALYGVSRIDVVDLSLEQSRTAATTMMVVLGLVVLYELLEPIELQHGLLIAALFAIYLMILAIPATRELFGLIVPRWEAWLVIGIVSLVAGTVMRLLVALAQRWVADRYAIDVT
jgi:cation-transporting ATPase E